jgi:hypothetical protein
VKLDDQAMSVITTHAEYMAAISEFDHLWESCAAKQFGKEMSRLLVLIEAYQQWASYTYDVSAQRTVECSDVNRTILS